MELRQYLAVLRRWWWLAVVLAIVGGVAGYFLTPVPQPVYEAKTTVLLNQAQDTLPTATAINSADDLVQTYAELMRTRAMLSQVIVNLGLTATPETLANRIRFQLVPGTNLAELTVTDGDPQQAADIANEVVAVFIQQYRDIQESQYDSTRQRLEQEVADIEQALEASRIEQYQLSLDIDQLQATVRAIDVREAAGEATAADLSRRAQLQEDLATFFVTRDRLDLSITQSQTRYQAALRSLEDVKVKAAESGNFMSVIEVALPGRLVGGPSRQVLNSAQAAAVGIVVGLGIVLMIEYFRVSVNTSEEVERLTGMPTLGAIVEIKGSNATQKLVTALEPRSPTAEAYRVLRTNVEFASEDGDLGTIVVTSGSPVEGKTTTAANLAVAIAQSGKRVILVDTDLRRPSLHKLFQMANTRGVTTALLQQGEGPLTDHLTGTEVEDLYLMPSGPLPPNPADLISSRRMMRLIEDLKNAADVVVFDSPPLLAVTDANLLARNCDAVLLVILAGGTRGDALKKTVDQLSQSGAKLLGVVLNRISTSANGYYSYGYYGPSSR